MKQVRQAVCLLLAILMALALAACGSADPTALIAKARQSSANMKNYDMHTQMTLRVGKGSQQNAAPTGMDIGMTMDMTVFTAPKKIKAAMEMQLFGMPLNLDMYMDESFVYSYVAGAWFKSPIADPAAGAKTLDSQADMQLYLDNARNFKLDGSETIGAYDCHRITGVISGDSIKTVLAQNALLEQAGLGESQLEDAGASLDDLGDMPITIWIDKKNDYPIQFACDMTEIMKSMMQKMDSLATAMEIDTFTMQMTMSQIDQAADFPIPPEALNAQEVDAMELQ